MWVLKDCISLCMIMFLWRRLTEVGEGVEKFGEGKHVFLFHDV
jgi:hypothetical protein